MKRKVLFTGAVFLASAVTMLLSQEGREFQPSFSQAHHGPQGAVLTGTWFFQIDLGLFVPGATLPSLLMFHNDGTASCSDSVAFGGVPWNAYRYVPFYGVWERTGRHEFKATFLTLRFDTTQGNMLVGIGRSRATIAFTSDWDHLAGTMHMDFLPCPAGPYSFLMCPNPLLAQESDWQPWSATMPSNFSFTGARVSNVPYYQ